MAADPLSGETMGNGHNSMMFEVSGITIKMPFSQVEYERFTRRCNEADKKVQEALADRRSIQAEIKNKGGKNGYKAFLAARRLRDLPGADRIEIDAITRRLMDWEEKPLGYQAGFDLTDGAPPPTQFQLTEKDAQRIDAHGYDIGKKGLAANSNPWNPGSPQHKCWLDAWARGNGDKVTTEIAPTSGGRRGRKPDPTSKRQQQLAQRAAKEKKGNSASGSKRGRQANGAAAAGAPSASELQNGEASRMGYENGLAGNYDNAARFADDEGAKATYEAAHAQGVAEREQNGAPLH